MLISRSIAMAVLLISISAASPASAMQLKLEGLKERLIMHLKEVHQCDLLTFEVDEPMGDDGWRFSIKNETTLEVQMQRSGDFITSLEAVSADQGYDALDDLSCLLVATMRALQPESIDTYDAFYDAAFYWARSKFDRYKTEFFTDTLTVQYEPLMFRFE
ncbi:hypothetical protein ACLPHM_04230 [Paenalcaligenes sp. Me131]|uniref:hypothetical protein n=1 Tax=Paenalcaligenes sp. Me131 TaxID=3392636 RepID=UPI003D2815BF